MEKDRRSTGPDRLTYNHSLAIKAGRIFLEKMYEEMGQQGTSQIEEWVAMAKKKSSMGPIEFLAEKTDTTESRILAMACRMTLIPVVDCEQVLGPNEHHHIIDGLPMCLLSATDYGAKTIVHCIPFLETLLDKELLADIHRAVKINFALTTPSGMLKHIQRTYNSGRGRNRMFVRAEEDKEQNFKREVEFLHARELLDKDFPKTASRAEILAAIEDERPRAGAPGETEWWALCSEHPFISLAPISSGKDLSEIISPGTQKKYNVVPVCEHGGILTVASRRGLKGSLRQEIIGELQKHLKLSLVLCSNTVIGEIIQTNLSNTISTTVIANQITIEASTEEEDTEIIDIQALAENDDASIIRVVQSILVGAINKRASDIHIAAHEDRTWIRYRIDGSMVDAPYQLPPQFWKAVLSRIKIMAGIDIRFSPIPKDGKFPMKVGGIDYDIRVATCAVLYGEKAVLRVAKKDADVPTLASLGFRPHEQGLIESLLESDHGMLIICGPTGSGKTKTLSATIYAIDRQRWNVITAENPVEIRIPLVEQTPIDGQNMTFGKFVPAALRQDPDYIMIGETRDQETTEEVIRASITGHIVLTTLHTNSAAGAPARLIDMGGQPFLITDSVKAVIAQRLIRKLCTNCCRPSNKFYSPKELIELGIDPDWMAGTEGLLDPVGCKVCNGTGYAGRTAIAEGYGMSAEIRRIILKEDADTSMIKGEMIKQGGKTLFQGAVELAAAQVTSIQEALAIQNMDS